MRENLKFYPVGLNLVNKQVLTVGAGSIAEKKIKTFLAFGAQIRVVAPRATADLLKLYRQGKIDLIKRKYRSTDIKKAMLVIAATNSRLTNERISRDSKEKNIWVNVVDQAKDCDFISTAIIRKYGITISVSSDGKNPGLSKDFKNFLKRKLNEFSLNRN